MKKCLFLTASIDPKNTPKVDRNSIELRENDYFTALRNFSKLNYKIVFCENSGYHSEKIFNFCLENNIEYLTFTSKESYKGKSHGEKEIFDYALAFSKYISESDIIVKITGRLYIENTSAILESISKSSFLVSLNFTKNLVLTDSRFFIFKKEFYIDYFKVVLEKDLDEERSIGFEKCLSRACHLAISDGKTWIPLPFYPIYSGYNAFQNKELQKDFFTRLKYKIYYKIKLFVLRQTI